MDELLTVKQVAVILQVHPQTVKHYITKGDLKASKSINDYRIWRHDLEEFINKGVKNVS